MTASPFQSRFDELVALLGHPHIVACANRAGLRQQSGALLEDAYLALAVALAPDLSVEIGAHEAGFSRRLKRRCPQTRVLAFEANPYVYKKYVTAPGNPVAAIDYRNMAICDSNGMIDLYVPVSWVKGKFARTNPISSLSRRTSGQFEYETVTVPASTLDAALDGIEFADAVAWIDVEGVQKQVITSAPAFLSRASAIYIEVENVQVWNNQPIAEEVAELLGRHGFVPLLRDNLANIQYNIVYIKNEQKYSDLSRKILDDFYREIEQILT